jgi:hypothetical protein
MTSHVRHRRALAAGAALPNLPMEPGELALNIADLKLFTASAGTPLPLIGVRFWAATAGYAVNDMVVNNGQIYTCKTAHAPKASFDPVDWQSNAQAIDDAATTAADAAIAAHVALPNPHTQYLLLTGGELSGDVTLSSAATRQLSVQSSGGGANLVLNAGAVGVGSPALFLQRLGINRWALMPNSSAEAGSNAGSDLEVRRYSDTGTLLGSALTIARSTGATTFDGNVTVARTVGSTSIVLSNPSNTGDSSYVADANTGKNASFYFRRSGLNRWLMVMPNTTEPGGNVGSDWELRRYDDTSALLGTALSINRATGLVTIPEATIPSVTGQMTVNHNLIVKRGGGTTTTFTVDNDTMDSNVAVNSTPGRTTYVGFRRNGSTRWLLRANNSAETGSNAGSDFALDRYGDSAFLDSPITISRSTGVVTINASTLSPAGGGSINTGTLSAIGGGSSTNISVTNTAAGAALQTAQVRNTNAGVISFGGHNGSILDRGISISTAGVLSDIKTGQQIQLVAPSDYRLKANYMPIDNGTELLSRMSFYEGEMVQDLSRSLHHYVLAHELQEVLPYAVTGEKDGPEMQSVDYTQLVPVFGAALQEALTRISSLENQVSELIH